MTTAPPREVIDQKYELLREIARGGQGVVYEARSLLTGQSVALKRLRQEFSQHGTVARRFIREASVIARFAHPHIVQVLDAGQDPRDGALYMVQPLLAGAALGGALQGHGRLRPREALDLIVPIMAALIAIHRAGVVHRDLKPDNIFLVRDPERGVRPVLLDFGIAKLLDADPTAPRTATGALIGTPLYMSPEQCRGERAIDARSDVWSVGVILFELIAGATPFTGRAVTEILANIVSTRAPRLDAAVAGVSRPLGDIVARALDPDRERRFATMSAFLEALLECPALDANTTGHDLAQRHHASLRVRLPVGSGPDAPVAPLLDAGAATQVLSAPDVSPWISDTIVDRVPPAGTVTLAYDATPARVSLRSTAVLALVGVLAGAAVTFVALRSSPPPTFTVHVAVEPRAATVELDGTASGTGTLTRELPRDGRPHTLRLRAAGYVTRDVTFRDEPPPAHHRLSREMPER
jgi:serine/threonine-protein kinase